jgi:hypothetical protein
MVVACIALLVALSGTSVAAIQALPKNSVGAKQLKKNAVTGVKVKANAITSPKVADNSLIGGDINEATLGTVPSATTAGSAAPSGAASGSLAGTYPAPSIAANVIGSSNIVDASQGSGLRKADVAAVVATVAFDPPNIAANSCDFASTAVPGALPGDSIILQPAGSIWITLIWAPWLVTNPNNVNLRFCNPTGFAYDGPALPFHVLLIR